MGKCVIHHVTIKMKTLYETAKLCVLSSCNHAIKGGLEHAYLKKLFTYFSAHKPRWIETSLNDSRNTICTSTHHHYLFGDYLPKWHYIVFQNRCLCSHDLSCHMAIAVGNEEDLAKHDVNNNPARINASKLQTTHKISLWHKIDSNWVIWRRV